MSSDLKSFLAGRLNDMRNLYVNDLEAMSEELLAKSPGGAARSGFDMTYEVMYVNRRLVARLRGEEPAPFNPADGWMKAPAEFCNKEHCLAQLNGSVDELIAAFNAHDDIELSIETPRGPTTPMELAHLAGNHLMYHDAQLNYIQSLEGDADMHWKM